MALDDLVDASYEQVWRFCAGLVDSQSGDDLAQETFVRVVRSLPSFAGQSSARTWLLGIARHVCIDELRARDRRRRRDGLVRALAELQKSGLDASEESDVADFLCQIEPERREAFVLTQMVGLSYDEAAQVCECPVGTIRSRVARARGELLDLLGRPELSESYRHQGQRESE
jgi:RNA polymerase sigma-70 factor, ECF subfamily